MWYLADEDFDSIENLEKQESDHIRNKSQQMATPEDAIVLDIAPSASIDSSPERPKVIQKVNSNVSNSSPPRSRSTTPINSYTLQMLDEDKLKHLRPFSDFLRSYTCYDIIPASGKSVVLDTQLPVRAAFHALEENGIKSAPLWDSAMQDYVGMITVSDFIDILLHFYKESTNSGNDIFEELTHHKIKTWREIRNETTTLLYTEPEVSLFDAGNTLIKHGVHRLPIIDRHESNSILHILTHNRILAFLIKNLPTEPPNPILSCTIGSLGIGTYDHVVTVLADTPLIVVLELLAARKISAVPIVDEHGVVIDVYSKSDVPMMVKLGAFTHADLDKPVHEVLSTYSKRPEQIHTCFKNDILKEVIDKCIFKRVHRLICVDSTKRVEGIVSLSDILKFFLL